MKLTEKFIGTTVYCIYGNSILKHKIGYIGKESFIVEDFNDNVRFDSLEWFFNEFDVCWSFNLSRAKELLINTQERYEGGKWKVVKIEDDYWEAEAI